MPLRTDHLLAAAADLAPVLTTDVTATSVTLHCTFSPGSSSRRLTCHGDEATRRPRTMTPLLPAHRSGSHCPTPTAPGP